MLLDAHSVREQRALDGKFDEAQLFEDAQHQLRVAQVVATEGGQVALVEAEQLRVSAGPMQELAFAEHRARHEVQVVLVEVQERATHEVQPVQHHTTGNVRAHGREAIPRRVHAQCAGPTAELQHHAAALRHRQQEAQIEVDDVPARKHVRIELHDSLGEGSQQRALAPKAARIRGQGRLAWRDQQHLRRAQAKERDREERLGTGIGLDVERENGQRRRPVRGREHGVLEEDIDVPSFGLLRRAGGRTGDAFERDRAPQAALHQQSRGQAHVGFEGAQALRACARGVGVERSAVARHDGVQGIAPQIASLLRGDVQAQRARACVLVGADPEARAQAPLAGEEGASVHEAPVKQDHGQAAMGSLLRLEDKANMGRRGRHAATILRLSGRARDPHARVRNA